MAELTELTFVSTADLNTSATAIGCALDLDFRKHDSFYLRGDYLRAEPSWGLVIVQNNDDLGEPAAPTHPAAPTVIRISADTTHARRLFAALQGVGLTRVES